MLESLIRQGGFCADYVRTLASAAGLSVRPYDLERDGIDLGIRFPGRVNGVASPGIEVQIQAWPDSFDAPSAAEWDYAGITEVQFNRLAGDDFTIPRYLVLVRVPQESGEYAEFRTDGMLFRHLAYYWSGRDESPVAGPRPDRHRSVRVPVANVLTVHSLRALVGSVHPLDGAPHDG
ncbi:DUF4365 domain-containing protein [Amycolatopsis sp. PS_44_ISF1]|uniref:DUF4365 domain-containing protein n=1 Tax=Amycolatopsis sp. PS_44_ISF1 TaxID=2974917 RepID=UPI0028DDA951|nr:DUF4365 domain-containing protein [Amycolatopsis sp. PS_44_ISF1]MDT8915064.1 DUF4365 domain-containing protein [Amycolatopsis sp. PS_44_ISF1]